MDATLPRLTTTQTAILIVCLVVTAVVLFAIRKFINIIIIDVCLLGDFTALRELICCQRRSRHRRGSNDQDDSDNNTLDDPNQTSNLPTENPISYYLHSMSSSKKLVLESTLLAMVRTC